MTASNELRGIVEEMAEDRGRSRNREGTDDGGGRGVRTLIFGGIAVVVLLAVVFLLLGGGEREGTEALLAIQERLDRMEMRLDRLEASEPELASVSEKLDGLQKSVDRLERERPSMRNRIEQIARRVESLRKEPTPPGKPVAGPSGGMRKHTVQKGETLFSIARRYALSLDDLCRLNGIDRDEIIQPGQTLVIQEGD